MPRLPELEHPTEPGTRRFVAVVLQLSVWLVLPSVGVVLKFGGVALTALFVGLAPIGLAFAGWLVRSRSRDLLTRARVRVLTAFSFVALAVALAVVYPIADSGRFGGGSDADDALDLAASRLVAGQYPYDVGTYLDNPISPMPGAVLLATPFVLLGGSALQGLFWLGALWFAVSRLFGERVALVALWTLLAASPVVLAQVLTGTDSVVNAMYVTLFATMAMGLYTSSRRPWLETAGAALLGVGLSSRANFVFVLPLVVAFVASRDGWRRALGLGILSAAVFSAVTLPFYLFAPERFSPLHTYNKLGQFDALLPHFAVGVIGVMCLATLYFFARRFGDSAGRVLQAVAIVQAIPVVCTTVAGVTRGGASNLIMAGYGVSSLFFGCLGVMLEAGMHTRAQGDPSE